MKFGVHLSTFQKSWNDDLYVLIKQSKEMGFDGVEIPLMNPDKFDVLKTKKILTDLNLKCTCGTGLNENEDISSLDSNIRDRGIKRLYKCIDIASALNAEVLGGVLYAPWGMCVSRNDFKDNYQVMVKSLQEVDKYANKKNVMLALELINRYESSVLNTVEDGLELLKQLNSTNIKLHFDTFHANIEEKNIKEAIIRGGKDIYHVHVCENDRGAVGTGSINFKEVKEALETIGYDNWITIENFVEANCEVGNDTFIYRNIEKNGFESAKIGLEYLKKLFNREGSKMKLNNEDNKQILLNIADMFLEKKLELASYDAVIGDGDHGITMARGAKVARENVSNIDNGTIRDYYKTYGRTLVSTLGGAMGPLFGSVFLEISKVTKGKDEIGLEEFANGFENAMLKVMELGGAKPNDKTMVDSMDSVVTSLKESVTKGLDLKEAFELANQAGIDGVEKTKPLIARRGRSKFLQEKAIGHQDAGATSFAYMISVINDYIGGK